MRIVGVALCVFSIASAQQPRTWRDDLPGAWGPLTDGWRLALYCEKQEYSAREPLWVQLLARNKREKSLKVETHKSPWRVAEFAITRAADGQVIKLRPYRDQFEKLERFADGVIPHMIDPGKLVSPGVVNLQKLYDLSPGAYTVTATCKLTSPDPARGTALVLSNQITISIVQDP